MVVISWVAKMRVTRDEEKARTEESGGFWRKDVSGPYFGPPVPGRPNPLPPLSFLYTYPLSRS